MTTGPERLSDRPIVLPFPTFGARVALAYKELNTAVDGTKEQKSALGPVSELPRPWDPETCHEPDLRHEVWTWLEDVVTWLNHEYAWDVAPLIPTCWPLHPHIVHEVAVVADQRRRAKLGVTSDPLEEWHRYCMPTFVDRMRARLKDHCSDGHKGWPSRGRCTRHASQESREGRENVYAADLVAITNGFRALHAAGSHASPRRLGVVDIGTGEILDAIED